MDRNKNIEVFRSAPIPKAVMKIVLPTMAVMLMMLIYNLADTFFIGRTGNDVLVAAVSLATPVFLLFITVGTMFGVGGTSVISRALGEGRHEYARKVSSFCMWSCIIVGILLAGLFLALMNPILTLIGASAETWQPAKTYLTIIAVSSPFILISNCFSNLFRAEGQPGKAMAGQMLGNILNIILDPIMILTLKWGIAGAAIATAIGNVAGVLFYTSFFLRGKSILSIHPHDFSARNGIWKSVLAIGTPASLGSLLMSLANIIINARIARYGDMALAGIGVATKITMVTHLAGMGVGQGVQALLGFCVGGKLWDRFKEAMRFSLLFALGLSLVLTGLCYAATGGIVNAFLTEPASFDYAVNFTHILLSTGIFFGVFYVLVHALQAMGAAKDALIINLSRQGIIYIPAIFILEAIAGLTGLVWAQPVADVISTALVAVLFYRTQKRMAQPAHDAGGEIKA